jgi:hypothetical protein
MSPALAGPISLFSDDFSDGDLVGWHVDEGNWTVKNGELSIRRVDYWDVSDYKLILVDGLEVGTFSLEVWLNTVNDSGAIAFWRQGWPTQMEVGLSSYWNTLCLTSTSFAAWRQLLLPVVPGFPFIADYHQRRRAGPPKCGARADAATVTERASA